MPMKKPYMRTPPPGWFSNIPSQMMIPSPIMSARRQSLFDDHYGHLNDHYGHHFNMSGQHGPLHKLAVAILLPPDRHPEDICIFPDRHGGLIIAVGYDDLDYVCSHIDAFKEQANLKRFHISSVDIVDAAEMRHLY